MKHLVVLTVLALSSMADDRLSPACIAILSNEIGDELDQDHSVCPDAAGRVSFRKAGTREINGIPDSEMRDLFDDPDLYGSCRDLFAEPPFGAAMAAIAGALPPADGEEAQRAMAKVFENTQWQWHFFNPPQSNGFTIYACVDLEPLQSGSRATIHLYKTMCSTPSIYLADLGRLNLGTRFTTVAAHELGHVIDQLSGCSGSFSSDPETRATVYGLVLAQCHARRWQSVYGYLADLPPEPEEVFREEIRQKALGCLRGKWSVMERQIDKLRAELIRDDGDIASPLQSISACAYAAGRGGTPQLDRCPIAER